jgi:molecular chaperone DnaK
VQSAIDEARKDLESDDPARLDAARQRVEQELHKVAEVLYRAQAAQGAGAPPSGGPAGAAPGSSEGDVIDAEYTEEKGDG